MFAAARVAIAAILFLILWGLGSVASYQTHGSLTAYSILAMAMLGLVWLLAAVFAFLAAISLYAPEHNSKITFSFLRLKAVSKPTPMLRGLRTPLTGKRTQLDRRWRCEWDSK